MASKMSTGENTTASIEIVNIAPTIWSTTLRTVPSIVLLYSSLAHNMAPSSG